MTLSVFWLQCGGCGGDTFSLLGHESPDLLELFETLGVRLLFHPSLSTLKPRERDAQLAAILSGEEPLDVLIVEGAVVRGPGGTGMFDTFRG